MLGTRTWKSSVLFLFAYACVAGFSSIAQGYDTPTVIINEVMWAKAEYIELYNTTDEDIDMDSWKIIREDSLVDIDDTKTGHKLVYHSSDIIPAHGFLVKELAGTGLNLVDGGTFLQLINKDGVVIDIANQHGAWFQGKNIGTGVSMERISLIASGDVATSWQTSTGNIGERLGTPGAENSIIATIAPTPTPEVTPTTSPISYSTAVYINEFMPNPTGDDTKLEFIELYNDSDVDSDLSGWQLDDMADGGSSAFIIPQSTSISAHDYILFYSVQTKISMNNDSDHVILMHPDGVISNDIEYDRSKEGYSYNYANMSNYQQSSTPTPGQENKITMPTPTASPTPKPNPTPRPTLAPRVYDFTSKIFINEVYPNPPNEDAKNEFIEIINGENRTVSLAGWQLDDEEKGSTPYHFKNDDTISAKSSMVLYRTISKIGLNDEGDSVRLIDPHENVIALITYGKAIKSLSYNRTEEGGYAWSDVITPNKKNIIGVHGEGRVLKRDVKKAPLKTARIAGIADKSSAISKIDSLASLPPIIGSRLMKQDIVGSSYVQTPARVRKNVFILFGLAVGVYQLRSGIFAKEKIWSRGK